MNRFRHALAQLGLALLNATLLLALALAVVVWQITARLDHLASVTVERMAARLVLPDLSARFERIEARLDMGQAAEELRALRQEIASLSAHLDPGEVARAVAGAMLDEAAHRLGAR